MALVVCKVCKRAFINGPEGEDACPECTSELQKIYPVVRNFLRDNEKSSFTAYEVSKILGIDIKSIEGLVSLGLIDNSNGTRPQETAKKPLKISPLTSQQTEEVLKKDGGTNSMHKYRKKSGEKESKRKGEKK